MIGACRSSELTVTLAGFYALGKPVAIAGIVWKGAVKGDLHRKMTLLIQHNTRVLRASYRKVCS